MSPVFGQSGTVHTFHNLGTWHLLRFVIVHVYAAIREDIMSRLHARRSRMRRRRVPSDAFSLERIRSDVELCQFILTDLAK